MGRHALARQHLAGHNPWAALDQHRDGRRETDSDEKHLRKSVPVALRFPAMRAQAGIVRDDRFAVLALLHEVPFSRS